ncbi:hypothetical protein [Helicobacter felis]|uniref:hypothetical protein n=1 Tax=Helicobacter felis TaxID=214 RepID=UPI000CF1083B|nr:hypothetical protein [Helicobacter felis]
MLRLCALLSLLVLGMSAEGLSTSLIHRSSPTSTPPTKKKKSPPRRLSAIPQWIYSSVFLTAYFDDGHYKQGYALLLPNGHYLTASTLVFDRGMYAQTIMAKMQDDSAPMLICVARLRVKAIDHNRGLALLSTHVFTNDGCQIRPESYYHARIYRKYAQNPLEQTASPTFPLYYPQVNPKNAFQIQALSASLKSIKIPYGRPLFGANGVFAGLISANERNAWVIKKETILSFLKTLKERKLF